MAKPLIIAVEGVDKTGKATQVAKMVEYLRQRGVACETIAYPNYNSMFGKQIKKVLTGEYGDLKNIPPEFIAMLYAIDRRNDSRDFVRGWLSEGKWVVFDRYTYSNLFNVARYPEEVWDEKIKFIEDIEFVDAKMPRPDLCLYLYVDPNIAYDNRHQNLKSYQDKPDLNESNLKLLTDVSRVYHKVAARDPDRWMIIDQMEPGYRMSIEEVWEKIRERLDELIDNANNAV